jgi:hypothetical protein
MFGKEIEKIEELLSRERDLFYEIDTTPKSVIVSFLIEDNNTIDYLSKLTGIISQMDLKVFITGFRNIINVYKNQFHEWCLEVEFVKFEQKATPSYTPPSLPPPKKEETIIDSTGLEVTEQRKRDFVMKSIAQEISSTELLFIDDKLKEKNEDFDGPIYGGTTNYYYWMLQRNVLNIMKYKNNVFVVSYFNSFTGNFRFFICYGISDIARLPIK